MTLHIKDNKSLDFKLPLPTALLKSKILIFILEKYSGINIEPLTNSVPVIHQSLKEYVKKHGHFIFIDIKTLGGERFFIEL